MTPEAQRIAIAEACGALARKVGEVVEYQRWEAQFRGVLQRVRFPDGKVSFCEFRNLPDYLGDLNAMNEAEKVLDDKLGQCRAYADLFENTGPCKRSRFGMIHATAAERAENFLRALGKWTPPTAPSAALRG